MKKDPFWLFIIRMFALGSFPVIFAISILSRDVADSLELVFFGWFLLFVALFPIYLMYEVVALIAVWKAPKYREYLGSNKTRLICFGIVASEAFAYYLTRLLAIGMRVQ